MRCTYKFKDMTRSNGISATVQMDMKCRHTNPGTCRRRNIRNTIKIPRVSIHAPHEHSARIV